MLDIFLKNSPQLLPRYQDIVTKINALEPEIKKLTQEQLQYKVNELKRELQNGTNKTSLIPLIFAIVREATQRTIGLRHYDVQLVGGLVLSEGKIAEMKTGEGKTLVALLPTFLNALYSKGVHVVTVNDYLARRDAEYVRPVHTYLGLSVGLIQENMGIEERKANYNCDIVYVTNNELGFDYLRDNMAFTENEVVQREFFYCVVDEVDSILIDEARTPLIISGANSAPTQKYIQTAKLANVLQKNIHYLTDEKNQNITLLEEGIFACEQALEVDNLYNTDEPWILYILNSLKAKELFQLSTHYIINENNEIIIVDEFTGRTMNGRRWSDGLHQAIEAKENVQIQDESQTLASITYQNLFLLYKTLSGMTGTAKTEEGEFARIYNLDVVTIPTHRPIKRKDFADVIYKNQYLKWQAIASECVEMTQLGRPILIGTTTIEKSELLAALLNEYKVPYRLLNARPENVESESAIIAQAGCKGAITIATNMAGRGTDILLGGNSDLLVVSSLKKFFNSTNLALDEELVELSPIFKQIQNDDSLNNYKQLQRSLLENEKNDNPLINKAQETYSQILAKKKNISEEEKKHICKLGGLHIIGTERHESRRIDNQLRGRAGRQGDPGSSKFFLSLDDRLLRLFGGDQILKIMQQVGFNDETPIQSSFLNTSLESAQKKVEAYYFDSRKQLFEYDQALNMQRNGIYVERKKILQRTNLRDWIIEYGERSLYDIITCLRENSEESISKFIYIKVQELLGVPYTFNNLSTSKNKNEIVEFFKQQFQVSYDLKETQLETIEVGLIREMERSFLLQQIDYSWKEHLQKISYLRDSIRWRAYGQRDPLTDYKKESFNFFVTMLTRIRHRVIYFILRSKIVIEN